MPIDDPISAVEMIAANEERSSSPLQRCLDAVLNALPTKPAAIAQRVNAVIADRLDKQALLVDVLVLEIRYHARRIDELCANSEAHRRFLANDFRPLLIAGLKRAEETRAIQRVRRIGAILANSLVTSPPAAADDIEDFMDLAMNLSDFEAQVLSRLCRLVALGSLPRSEVPAMWMLVYDFAPGPQLVSVCAKLAGLGLIANANIAPANIEYDLPDFPEPHVVLPKGRRFIEFVRSDRHATETVDDGHPQ